MARHAGHRIPEFRHFAGNPEAASDLLWSVLAVGKEVDIGAAHAAVDPVHEGILRPCDLEVGRHPVAQQNRTR